MENRLDARERMNALTLGMKILLPATALLFIDMFLRWQEVCADLGPLGETCGGQNGWNGLWGVLLGLLTVLMLVWLGLQIANVDISGYNLPVTAGLITLGLGVLIFALALLKNLVDDYSTIWSYIGVILAALGAYGAWQRSRELEETGPVTRARTAEHGDSTTTAGDVPGTTGVGGGSTAGGMVDDTPGGTGEHSHHGGMSGGMAGGTTGVPPATGPAPGSGMGPDDELGTGAADTELPPRDRDEL